METSCGVVADPASSFASEELDSEEVTGRPKPLAKEGGLAKPARPKTVISAKPTRMARHSAGGGRLAKRDCVVVAIVAML